MTTVLENDLSNFIILAYYGNDYESIGKAWEEYVNSILRKHDYPTLRQSGY